MEKEIEGVLAAVAAALPDLMHEALRNYEESQTAANESDIKNIKLRQDTGRASIAHIMQMIKLAKTVHAMDIGGEGLAREIESARREIDAIQEQRKRDE